MYIQYGCAYDAPEGWRNFDASATLKWERTLILGRLYTKNAKRFPANAEIGDIVKGLPVNDESCKGVFASHVLEHLSLDDFHVALDNTRRILRKGGIFRLVVPNLEWYAREYIARISAGDSKANDFFLRSTHLGQDKRVRDFWQFLYKFFATSHHLWMWDVPSMRGALADHGFRDIRRCYFGDSSDPTFKLVEREARYDERSFGMEAVR
ncbi:MAG: methyltransferase domain-containing protein [Acidobacteriaceae bacterium]